MYISINGVVVTWVVAIDPPGVRFPLNAMILFGRRGGAACVHTLVEFPLRMSRFMTADASPPNRAAL